MLPIRNQLLVLTTCILLRSLVVSLWFALVQTYKRAQNYLLSPEVLTEVSSDISKYIRSTILS